MYFMGIVILLDACLPNSLNNRYTKRIIKIALVHLNILRKALSLPQYNSDNATR